MNSPIKTKIKSNYKFPYTITCLPGYRISLAPGQSCEINGDIFALCVSEVNVKSLVHLLSLGHIEISYLVDDMFSVRNAGKILHADNIERTTILNRVEDALKTADETKTLEEVSKDAEQRAVDGNQKSDESSQDTDKQEESKEDQKTENISMSEEDTASGEKSEDTTKQTEKLSEAKVADKPKTAKKVQVK